MINFNWYKFSELTAKYSNAEFDKNAPMGHTEEVKENDNNYRVFSFPRSDWKVY
jgi:hypothetical protein